MTTSKMRAALYGGIIMALISSVPGLNLLNCLCCAGIMAGGFFAVFFYRQELKDAPAPFSATDAMLLGIMAGINGAFIGAAITGFVHYAFGGYQLKLLNMLIDQYGFQVPANVESALRQALEQPFTITVFIITVIELLVIDTLFGMVGALIGYSFFRSRH